MVVSSIVHGLVYDVIFKATRHLGLGPTILVAVVGIGAVWGASKLFPRRSRSGVSDE